MMCWAGDVGAGRHAMAPFVALAEPLADLVRPIAYPEMFPPEDDAYHPVAVPRTLFLEHLDVAAAARLVARLETAEAAFRFAQLRVLGGAMARVPADATAFAHRASRILAVVGCFVDAPEDQAAREAWVEDLVASIRQDDEGAYVNFLTDEGEDRIRAAYPGSTWDRLAAIKAHYDPDNLFRRNQNVPPAAAAS
jgi:FAD/FMN-containing dehydrogenase